MPNTVPELISTIGRVEIPVAASEHIYQGDFVRYKADGYLEVCDDDTTGTLPCGVALAEKDNSTGSDGDLWCPVDLFSIVTVTGSSGSVANNGNKMYAATAKTVTSTGSYNPLGVQIRVTKEGYPQIAINHTGM